ncbi:MAG: hypothetical protein ACQETG_03000 [Thermodesulfobacteriota bacterium]
MQPEPYKSGLKSRGLRAAAGRGFFLLLFPAGGGLHCPLFHPFVKGLNIEKPIKQFYSTLKEVKYEY